MEAPLHKLLKPLEAFIGTWRGKGKGIYPTIKSFSYGEEATFAHWGKPVLSYRYAYENMIV